MAHLDTEAVSTEPQEYSLEEASEALASQMFNEEEQEVAPQDEASENEEDAQAEPQKEEEQAEGEPETVIDPPVSWSKEKKEQFRNLPPEAQSIIVDRESERDTGLQAKMTETAEERKSFEAKRIEMEQNAKHYHEQAALLLDRALGQPDPSLNDPGHPNYNPDLFWQQVSVYKQNRAQMEDHQRQVRALDEQQKARDEIAQREYKLQRDEQLRTELLPGYDSKMEEALIAYANESNITQEEYNTAPPEHVILLDKAMKYDQLQAEKPTTKNKLKTVPKVQKAGGRTSAQSKEHSISQAKNNLKKSGTLDDAAAVLAY